jgi:hypothetical protein
MMYPSLLLGVRTGQAVKIKVRIRKALCLATQRGFHHAEQLRLLHYDSAPVS